MIPTAEEVIKVAASYVGYKEKKTNAQLDSFTANAGSNNYTMFARDTKGYWGNKQGFEWCTTFVLFCFCKAANMDFPRDKEKTFAWVKQIQPFTKYGASCKYQTAAYKNAKRWSDTPHVGDQAFFTRGHTGLVEKFDGKKLILIEGNSNNRVERRAYAFPNAKFSGFGRPFYADKPAPAVTPTVTYKVVKGDTPEKIAAKFGITPADLIAANIKDHPKMTIDYIVTGWTLKIPSANKVPYKARVTSTNGLNVRTGTGTSYKKIGVLKYNAEITVLEEKNGWGRHTFNGQAGWSCLNWLERK